MHEFETRTFGSVTLVRGDCLDVMRLILPKSVSLIFADLPYQVTNLNWDIKINLKNFNEAMQTLAAKQYILAATATQPFSSDIIQEFKNSFRYELVWNKSKASGLHATRRPLSSHESILIFGSRQHTYAPQMIPGRKYAHSGSLYESKWHGKQMLKKERRAQGAMRYPKSILSFCEQDLRTDTLHGHKPDRLHPTQKPIALLEWLIATYTNPGDLVLDPTAGSGTTGCAALNLGRKAVLIEKDPAYYEVMCKRVAEHQAKLTASASNPV